MHKYKILDVIDEGAYGIVWKAINKETQSLVAIKEFKEGDDDEDSHRAIQREIRMLKLLKSEYVVGLKEAFKKKEKIYLIFEYFESNLLRIIEKFPGGLEPSLICSIIYQIVKCLRFLHSKNIVHRDVKPENILLNFGYSKLKFCDFGFARAMPGLHYDLTYYVATRWYRCPELLVGDHYGKPADIWALGCIVGYLVDGYPLFPGDDEIDQLNRITKSIGNMTATQIYCFHRNIKFTNVSFPTVDRSYAIERRFLAKIEKNALSFLKSCLRMNPEDRMTIDQAISHPYLRNHFIEDKVVVQEQPNMLQTTRNLTIPRNDSKLSMVREEEAAEFERIPEKEMSNMNRNKYPEMIKKEPQTNKATIPRERQNYSQLSKYGSIHKIFPKKSESNFHNTLYGGREPPKKVKANKYGSRKLAIIIPEDYPMNVNRDVKINMKIVDKSRGIADLQSKRRRKNNSTKFYLPLAEPINIRKLPYIKNKTGKMTLDRPLKKYSLITIVGYTKYIKRLQQ